MIYGLTLAGAIHSALALTSIAVGLIQLRRRKGGAPHRARGYAYVCATLIADGAAMLIYQFTGRFNIFHVGAVVNLVTIAAGMVPLLQIPRPPNWMLRHYYCMSWSYVGLLAAALSEFVVRSTYLASREQVWIVTAATTMVVTAIGYVLIERHRPASDSQPIQHEVVR
ncbi:DUF2306 domain-containing protein [Bradyrhizobium sp.]|jgi:uncharacterized membrane protein|uniref:DUF2306 domain-containing protein n=1 Tax=Bradyrhizobium sp. TaxID=376 RepID=UPI003C142C62